ncbi:MAG: efflux RND transporter periplasmic adaptor subunit [Pseudomonadota bacterium]
MNGDKPANHTLTRPLPRRQGDRVRAAAGLLLMAAATWWGSAAQAQSLGCLIEPERVMDLGSPVIGVVQEVVVERGQSVKKGEVIARLHSDVERQSLALARARADARAQLSAAQATLVLTRRKHERIQSLVAQNFMSAQASDQSGAEAEVAERNVGQLREQQQLAEREWQVAQAQLALRVVRSPIDGVVVEKYLSAGERVDDKPIVRVAAIDQLRVEAVFPSAMYARLAVGMAATVKPELLGAEARVASVTSIDRVLDAASNTFRVRLRLDNVDQRLPAGVRCTVALTAPAGEAAPSVGSAAPSAAVTAVTPRRPAEPRAGGAPAPLSTPPPAAAVATAVAR